MPFYMLRFIKRGFYPNVSSTAREGQSYLVLALLNYNGITDCGIGNLVLCFGMVLVLVLVLVPKM